ncbi:MAG: xanthine dehydrogenase family protein molybdopterin-binding subunit [Proteobacteria bacterium]|nr:xanthine dehydrogenase family protein molybdopterin-binding subunit [Burkholderiales bacterium]
MDTPLAPPRPGIALPGDRSPSKARQVIGTRAPRIEDPALLRGEGRYLDDLRIEALHAAFLRSPHAHARIAHLDCAAAGALPGVVAVFDATAIARHVTNLRMPLGFPSATLQKDITPWVLSGTEVAFVGEAIVMVVAETRYIAEDALALIDIDFAPLPVVHDVHQALDAAAPLVRSDAVSNIAERVPVGFGEVEQAFARAPHVFAEALFVHRGAAHPMEGRGVLARYDAALDTMTVWTSTQMSHEVMHAVAVMLGMDPHNVRVIAPDVGGGFGAKYLTYPEEVAVPAAARALGRPVKWVEDRAEHFVSAIHERDQYWDVEIAVDARALILGVRGRLLHDQGAYTPQGINLPYNAATSVTGPYRVPAYAMEVLICQTNKTPVVPVRGAGYPQAAFVMERLLDRVARELALDRAEVRARNLIPPEKMPYEKGLTNRAGVRSVVDSGNYAVCQSAALARIDYAGFRARQTTARAQGRYLGLGLANAVKATSRGPFESAVVRVSPSGRIGVYTGALAMGQGLATALAQICAEQLNVPVDSVHVTCGDTGYVSLGMGGFASRQTVMAGSSVHLAALEVRNKALKVAEQMLEIAADDLVLKDGRVEVAERPHLHVSLGEIARKLKGAPGYSMPAGITPGLEATGMFQTNAQAHANMCHACEVEVDIGTGGVRILRYVAVHDSGTLVNPMLAEGQIHGGIVHGIGNALFEKMGYDDEAQPITGTFADYLLPTSTEIPQIEVIFFETPSPTNPIGVKGIGEAGTIPVAPAIVSAVEDALAPFGVQIAEAPLSPVRILELILGEQP